MQTKEDWKRYYLLNRKAILERRKRFLKSRPYHKMYRNIRIRSQLKGLACVGAKEFSDWIEAQHKRCFYCDKDGLKFRIEYSCNNEDMLTIDRKDNNGQYVIENMCVACWRCNKAKSNVFSYDQFREIAQKYLKQ